MSRDIQDVPIVHFGSPSGTAYKEDRVASALSSLQKLGWVEVGDE